jgi:hypothetical protein
MSREGKAGCGRAETGFAQNDAQNGIDPRASGPVHDPFDVSEILFVGHFRTAGEGGDRVVSEEIPLPSENL